jgi:hypothetical protein
MSNQKLTLRIPGAPKVLLPAKLKSKPNVSENKLNLKLVEVLVLRHRAAHLHVSEKYLHLTDDQFDLLETFLENDPEKENCDDLALKYLAKYFPGQYVTDLEDVDQLVVNDVEVSVAMTTPSAGASSSSSGFMYPVSPAVCDLTGDDGPSGVAKEENADAHLKPLWPPGKK